jgi:menaquinone-dependent protoporphyrinogen oxidase
MRILVAYASKLGATEAIAERLAERLIASGLDVDLRPVRGVTDPSLYDAFVIGSAIYIGHWQKEATEFVREHAALLADRPVWLFSSGPLGTEPTDAQGRDVRQAAQPREIAELREIIRARDHRVFFGALDPARLGVRDQLLRMLPAGRALLPEGDFRDWPEIEAWAEGIAESLTAVPAGPS